MSGQHRDTENDELREAVVSDEEINERIRVAAAGADFSNVPLPDFTASVQHAVDLTRHAVESLDELERGRLARDEAGSTVTD